MSTSINIPGLPEGLEPVRWGKPEEGEYVMDQGRVRDSNWGSGIGLIVKPASGYRLRFREDLGSYHVSKQFQTRRIMFGIAISDEGEESLVRDAISRLCGGLKVEYDEL